ncbi:MAG: DUF1559 domain-containing protein [Planctomycetes bacterium]|nr:DUF1559 domain-containing protein [Planctomycetota bacterium]
MPKHPRVRHLRVAFTLVEMLVVIAIIGVLIALLLPAIQSAREAARRTACATNLRQLGIAMNNFESGQGHFPPSRYGAGSWSALALIVPYLEQGHLFEAMDFTQSYSVVKLNGKPLPSYHVPVYLCPSETRKELKNDSAGVPTYVPINYGLNMGTWLVWDPGANGGKGQGGDGVFFPGPGLTAQQIGDGLSNTLCATEVRTYTSYYRGSADPSPNTIPTSPADICALGGSSTFKSEGAHVEWTDGKVHETGFTTVFAPNTNVPCNGSTMVDYVGWSEGKTPNPSNIKTYAAVTARSHHPGLVQVVMMEGSVRSVSNDIDIASWRALSTRNGKDTASQSP